MTNFSNTIQLDFFYIFVWLETIKAEFRLNAMENKPSQKLELKINSKVSFLGEIKARKAVKGWSGVFVVEEE